MPAAIVTGSGDLVGSEAVRHFPEAGFDVIGLDNDSRATIFGHGGLQVRDNLHSADIVAAFEAFHHNPPFQADYPAWKPGFGLRDILHEIHDANAERWLARP